jgi:hypothetical protein
MKYKKRGSRCPGVEAFPVRGCDVTITRPDGDVKTAMSGDWLVKSVSGKLYPVENEIFQKTYEVIPDGGS